jgi:hypothetical protein
MGLALLLASLPWLLMAIVTGWDVAQFMGYLAVGLGTMAELAESASPPTG